MAIMGYSEYRIHYNSAATASWTAYQIQQVNKNAIYFTNVSGWESRSKEVEFENKMIGDGAYLVGMHNPPRTISLEFNTDFANTQALINFRKSLEDQVISFNTVDIYKVTTLDSGTQNEKLTGYFTILSDWMQMDLNVSFRVEIICLEPNVSII